MINSVHPYILNSALFQGNGKNIEGVIFFETVNDLKGIIAGCTRDNYVKRLKAITENYLMSDTYRVPENWIFENYKFLFE